MMPMQSGDIASTAMAARVVKAYARTMGGEQPARRLALARRWLLASVPANTDEAAFRLLGLRWRDADPVAVAAAATTLRGRQLDSGGWAQIEGVNADAHATGVALVAL